MILHGRVKNGMVVFQSGDAGALPDGTLVKVMPVEDEVARPSAVPAAAYVSKEQKEALLRLIGIWKTEQPPNDEQVERIVEEQRMKKYG